MKKNNTIFLFFLMPTIGASIHIIQKFLFELSYNDNNQEIKFQKPYFFTWLGSLGLFLTYLSNWRPRSWNSMKSLNFNRKPFFQLALSTLFNLAAGVLSNVTSLYLNYSVSLMLRSSTLIFGAIVNVYYFNKPLPTFQLYSIFLTIVSLFFITLAALLSGSKTTHRETTPFFVAIMIIVRVLSKSLQAISMIIEEKVMSSFTLTPIEVTGFSGIWSLTFSSLILIYVTIRNIEPLTSTLLALQQSKCILILSIATVIIFAVWTILSLKITKMASAIARMVFDQLTIVIVWVVQLSINWIICGNENLEKRFLKTGEAWTKWSWLQLFGFAIMVFGSLVYQKIVKIPWIDYDEYTNLMQYENKNQYE